MSKEDPTGLDPNAQRDTDDHDPFAINIGSAAGKPGQLMARLGSQTYKISVAMSISLAANGSHFSSEAAGTTLDAIKSITSNFSKDNIQKASLWSSNKAASGSLQLAQLEPDPGAGAIAKVGQQEIKAALDDAAEAQKLLDTGELTDPSAPQVKPVDGGSDVTARPSRVRRGTEQGNWDNAANGENGGKLCPTCGKEVHSLPRTTFKDWDNDHVTPWRSRDLNGLDRKGVLDNYNHDTQLRCVGCNRSDNGSGN